MRRTNSATSRRSLSMLQSGCGIVSTAYRACSNWLSLHTMVLMASHTLIPGPHTGQRTALHGAGMISPQGARSSRPPRDLGHSMNLRRGSAVCVSESREEEGPDSPPSASRRDIGLCFDSALGVLGMSTRPAGPRACGAGSPASVGLDTPQHYPPQRIRRFRVDALGD